MKAISLFAGVGGFDLALERNGFDVVASVEIDKHARSVLAKQFPKSHLLEDVKNVTGEQLFKYGFNSDGIIVGGFPCQDLSVAGKRRGLAGERSGLFWEIYRLLDETKAKWFILENVPGLLSSNGGRDLGIILGSLAELGYGVAYRILDAQYFGVPQRRRRIFIVGCLGDDGRTPAQILAITKGRRGYFTQGKKQRKGSATTIARGLGATGIAGTLAARDYKSLAADDLLDNKAIIFDPHRSDGVRIQGNTTNTLTSMMGTGGNNMPMVAYPIQDGRELQKKQNGLGYSEEQSPAYTLDTTGGQSVAYAMHGAMVGRNDNAGPKGSGFFGENEPSYTLTASSQARHGVAAINNNNSVVRRLTPLECERLQGFPDNWTAGQTDGHRYKQMGNAVAVPVVEWIIKRLVQNK